MKYNVKCSVSYSKYFCKNLEMMNVYHWVNIHPRLKILSEIECLLNAGR